MRPFPDDHELIGFFEVEPEILSTDAPWAYNELKFKSVASNGTLYTTMQTGSEVMELKWYQGEQLIVQLDLVGVSHLEIGNAENGIAYNTLLAGFRDQNVDALALKIRPYISIEWAYNDHI